MFDVLVKFGNYWRKNRGNRKKNPLKHIFLLLIGWMILKVSKQCQRFYFHIFSYIQQQKSVPFSIFEIVIIFFIRSKGMHTYPQILHEQSQNNRLFCCNLKLSNEMLQFEDLNNEINRNENWGCAESITQSTTSLRNQKIEGVKETSKLQKISLLQRKKMMNVKIHARAESDLCWEGVISPSFREIDKNMKENNEEDRNRFSSDSDYFKIFQSKSKNSKKSLKVIKHNSNINALSTTIQQHCHLARGKQTPHFPRKQQTTQQDHQYMLFLNDRILTQPCRSKLDLGRNLPTYQSLDIQGMSSLQTIGKYQ